MYDFVTKIVLSHTHMYVYIERETHIIHLYIHTQRHTHHTFIDLI